MRTCAGPTTHPSPTPEKFMGHGCKTAGTVWCVKISPMEKTGKSQKNGWFCAWNFRVTTGSLGRAWVRVRARTGLRPALPQGKNVLGHRSQDRTAPFVRDFFPTEKQAGGGKSDSAVGFGQQPGSLPFHRPGSRTPRHKNSELPQMA